MRKERPILFSTLMVQALLAGRKTQTRRIVKLQPGAEEIIGKCPWVDSNWAMQYATGACKCKEVKCPYGQVGDILWVRESSAVTHSTGPSRKRTVWYKADNLSIPPNVHFKWKPSIHMFRASCRIWLETTDIRVERVGEISEPDAVAEGIEDLTDGQNLSFKDYMEGDHPLTAVASYKSLWQSINGLESWEVNPFCWAITFKILSTTGKPADL